MKSSTLLCISRPGLWLVFIWLYVWPTGANHQLLVSKSFWIGLFYCTFPLNLLVYGMNDLVDEDVDKDNPRKGNYIYGAKANRRELAALPFHIFAWAVAPLVVLVWYNPDRAVAYCTWLVFSFFVNFVYNNKPFQMSRKCPWELPTMILGHYLIPILSCLINDLSYPPIGSWLYHACLLARSHVWLEYADIECDKKEGKRTIAVALGPKLAFYFVIALTCCEAIIGFLVLECNVLGVFSFFGMVVFFLNSTKSGKVKNEKTHVSVSQSLVGAVLMMYVWYIGVFVDAK